MKETKYAWQKKQIVHKMFKFNFQTYQQMFKCLITLIQMIKTMFSTHKVISNNEHLVICFNVEKSEVFGFQIKKCSMCALHPNWPKFGCSLTPYSTTNWIIDFTQQWIYGTLHFTHIVLITKKMFNPETIDMTF